MTCSGSGGFCLFVFKFSGILGFVRFLSLNLENSVNSFRQHVETSKRTLNCNGLKQSRSLFLSHKKSQNVGSPELSRQVDHHQGPNYFYFLFYNIFTVP